MSHEDDSGIKVSDKRRFTQEGESREVGEEERRGKEEVKKEESSAASKKEAEKNKTSEKKEGRPKAEMPEIDFSMFVLSLTSSAQVHMGLIPNPATGKSEKNMDLAKQTIDIIGILQEKTVGNLSKDEQRLLESVLYDLRMKYVELSK